MILCALCASALQSGRVGDTPLPELQPDGWDWHFPADVKDRAPQDVTLGTSLLYHKTAYNGAVKFWNAAKMATFPVSS